MLSKRELLRLGAFGALAGLAPRARAEEALEGARMPDESAPHKATWMGFGPTREIWGAKLMEGARKDLARIAKAIARFEPVNMLVREKDRAVAAETCGPTVNLVACEINDLWLRDTGPVFTKGPQGLIGVNFNFNGWGGKQEHELDARVTDFVTERAGARSMRARICLEGGGVEADGEGTAIITESCVLNENRNPGLSKADCEAELKRLLGLSKIIWLPGIKEMDITDGHTDFYVRFGAPGSATVVAGYDPDPESFDHAVTRRHLEMLQGETDAKGRPLTIVTMTGPSEVRPRFRNDEFAAGYINFYVCNGAVIAPEFGDSARDGEAREKLEGLFPGREIVQLNIDAIAAGGGGIHCTTQQEPA